MAKLKIQSKRNESGISEEGRSEEEEEKAAILQPAAPETRKRRKLSGGLVM